MKIKMLVSMAGSDISYQPGQIIEVSNKRGEAWVNAGIAEAVKIGRPKKVIEIKSAQKAKK